LLMGRIRWLSRSARRECAPGEHQDDERNKASPPVRRFAPVCTRQRARPAQARRSLDHLVGAGEDQGWDREPKGFGGFQIDDQFEFHHLLDR
jgi:hypothetical protein